MKKTLIITGLLLGALTLGACGKTDEIASATYEEMPASVETETSISANVEKEDTAKEEDDVIPDSEPGNEQKEEITYFYTAISKTVSFMSDDSIKTVNLAELEYVIGAGNGYAFFTYYEDGMQHLGAYNLDEEISMDILESSDYISSIDVYEDVLYVMMYSYSESKYIERAFKVDSFEEVDNNQLFFDEISDYSFYSYQISSAGNRASVKRLFDTVGYVLLGKDNVVYRCMNSELYQLFIMPDYFNICYYDEDYIAYLAKQSGEDRNTTLTVYENQTAESDFITGELGHFLGFEGVIAYYTLEDSSVYGRTVFNICSFNCVNNEVSKITSLQKNPGVVLEYPGVEGFTISKDYLYFVADDGMDICWYVAPKQTEEKVEASPTAMFVKSSPIGSIGHAEAVSDTYYCNKCGEPLLKYYDEYLVIDVPVSEYANYMNEDMKSASEKILAENIQEIRSFESEDCSEHAESYSLTTIEDCISEAYFISSSIMVINSDGYWYGGGAHGMPMSGHIMFDIRTGKRLTLDELFSGTEEELKTIIATKVKEDFEACGYGEGNSPYFASTSAEIYEDVYSYISKDAFAGKFVEDGIYVEFAPYILGPYASGTITFFVSYEDLGITLY